MRLYEIAKDLKSPAIVYHPICGQYILLPDCGLLDLGWTRLSVESKSDISYNNQWSVVTILTTTGVNNERGKIQEM